MNDFWIWVSVLIKVLTTAILFFMIGAFVGCAIRSSQRSKELLNDASVVFGDNTENESKHSDNKAPDADFKSKVCSFVVFQSGFPFGTNGESVVANSVFIRKCNPVFNTTSIRSIFKFVSDEIHVPQLIEYAWDA